MRAETAKRAARVLKIIDGFAGEFGLNDTDLAAVCQKTPQTFSSARRKDPGSFRLEELIALARVFGVSLGELVEGQGKGLYVR
jgi:hypothetical protein